jgi:hypothetical protein
MVEERSSNVRVIEPPVELPSGEKAMTGRREDAIRSPAETTLSWIVSGSWTGGSACSR